MLFRSSNGGHVGASIQRVQAWKRTIDQQGIKAWSDQFMRDRFHDKALDADRYRWYAAMQEGWKRDAIPGYINESWAEIQTPGTYRGQCAELCGKDHGFMPIVVEVKSVEDFKKWAGEQKKLAAATADDPNKTYTADELKARGEKVYAQHCTACHQANGQGIPNTFPALDGSAVVKGAKDAHLDIVANGSKKKIGRAHV